MASKNKTIVTGNNLELNVKNNIGDFNKIIGNTTQDTTKGKNALNIFSRYEVGQKTSVNGIDFVVNKDGSVTANGTATDDAVFTIVTNSNLGQDAFNGTYILNGCPAGGSLQSYRQTFWVEGDKTYSDFGNGVQFTKSKNGNWNSVIIIYKGIKVTNLIFKPMIRLATITDDTFEKYTGGEASPNPDYPSKVETVGSNVNLFDKDNASTFAGNIASTTSTTITVATYSKILYIPITGGKTYSVQKKKDSKQNRFVIATSINTPNVGIEISQVAIVDNYSEYTISTNKNANYLCVLYIQTNGAIMTEQETLESIKIEEGSQATLYSPYGKGSVEVKVRNKNKFHITQITETQNNGITFTPEEDKSSVVLNGTATANASKWLVINSDREKIEPGEYYLSSCKTCSNDITLNVGILDSNNKLLFSVSEKGTPVKFTITETSYINNYLLVAKGKEVLNKEIKIMIVKANADAENYVPHKQQTHLLYLPFELCKIGDYKDYIFKENNKWYKHKEIGKRILKGNEGWGKSSTYSTANYVMFYLNSSSYTQDYDGYCDKFVWGKTNEIRNAEKELIGHAGASINIRIKATRANTVDDFNTWLSNNNTTVYYVLATPVDEEITDTTLIQQLNELENILLYNGINYISMEGNGTFEFQYGSKFDFYLSENNYLILNDTNKYLCSISESEIPDMPEAVDTTAKIAGRDGDIVLSTTYNPIPFNLVIYTEDNLSLQEKEEQKRIINQFWHEMKKQKKIFELESSQMFYEVKYNGLLECENHPKHLRFSLPFKSSRPYAYANEQKEMVGNSSVNSDTIEPVGFECVIKGPANNPIIYFNNYEMKYNNIVPENSKLVINTNNSTIVLKNALGVETNAMRYYNHEFPKIENGVNTLDIKSGINDKSNVHITWNDLVL